MTYLTKIYQKTNLREIKSDTLDRGSPL